MTVLRRLASIASWVLRRGRAEQQLDDEIRSFVEMATADRIRDGVPPAEARRLALAEIGGVERMKESVRDGRHGALLDDLARDARYAFRLLARQPAFAAVIVATLALAIGVNVALFSVVNSVLLRPLPYHEPDRLVRLASTDAANNLTRVGFSYSRFLEVQQRQEVFSAVALSAGYAFTLTGRGDPEQLIGLHVSAALLPTLGLQPIIGRNFSSDEDRRGGPRVVMISQQMWQQRFNREASVLGQALTLDGLAHTIIGVLPEAAMAFPLNHQQIWVPRPTEVPYIAQSQLQGGSYFFRPIVRLKPGVSLAQAREAMNVIAGSYRAAHPENLDAPSTIELVPLLDDAVGAHRKSYLLLLGAVACVLLIACANVANLLLARFAGRQREIATRLALGVRRGALVRQIVSESMLLAVFGGALGVLLAGWTLRVLAAVGTDGIPRAAEIRIDPTALGFALIATLATGLLIGLLPAMQASGVNVLEALRAGRGATGSGRHLRAGLLVVEVSLSLVLLIATGLLLASFERLQRVEPGFEAQGVFTAQITLSPRYSRAKLIEFYEQLSQRLTTLPGTSSAAISNRVPLTGDQSPTVVAVAGRPLPPLSERTYANRHLVSSHYFSTLRIPLRAGRDFDGRDNARAPQVVIINETFARRLFPGEDPVGRTLVTGMAQQQAQVVGVAADIRGENLNTPPEPEYFLPLLQRPETLANVLLRSDLPPAAVAALVRDALRTIDPDLPLLQPGPLTARIAQTMANRRLALMLLATFAALALMLASLGVYSVMAHLVAFRTSEIGLRMALGASPDAVMRMVIGHGCRLTLVGIACGIAGALVVSRVMRQMLFEVDPADPRVYFVLSVMLLLVTVCASFFPARRATRIDPVIALRTE